MHNITLVATIHSEIGMCNADELYKILEEIKPAIIFDELPREYFDLFYNATYEAYYSNHVYIHDELIAVPLEVKCNKRYKQNYNVDIIPIDIDTNQEMHYSKNAIDSMFKTFFKNEDYLKLEGLKENLITQEGFHFLNSSNFLEYQNRKEYLEKTLIESNMEQNKLLVIYNEFRLKQYHNREFAMLNNIYNFSKYNNYDKAVLLIGAEHKKSFVQKIAAYEKQIEMHLNWIMFGD